MLHGQVYDICVNCIRVVRFYKKKCERPFCLKDFSFAIYHFFLFVCKKKLMKQLGERVNKKLRNTVTQVRGGILVFKILLTDINKSL